MFLANVRFVPHGLRKAFKAPRVHFSDRVHVSLICTRMRQLDGFVETAICFRWFEDE